MLVELEAFLGFDTLSLCGAAGGRKLAGLWSVAQQRTWPWVGVPEVPSTTLGDAAVSETPGFLAQPRGLRGPHVCKCSQIPIAKPGLRILLGDLRGNQF